MGSKLRQIEANRINMNKLKTKKAALKRFKITKKGKVKRNRSYGNHLLTKKDQGRKRKYKKSVLASRSDTSRIKKMLGYR